jgi:hypothetical protein
MNTRPLLALGLTLLALPGCIIVATDRTYHVPSKKELAAVRQVDATQPLPTFRSEYREELSKLAPGMSVEEFRGLFPQSVFVEQVSSEGQSTDAYSVKLNVPYRYRGGEVILTAQDEAWFYFRDGAFVKWGEPSQWP